MLKEKVIEWTKNYLNSFGGSTKAVIGISGGKDSTIALKLLIEAVGRDRIYAANLPHKPNGIEPEVEQIAKEFDVEIHTIPLQGVYEDLSEVLIDDICSSTGTYDVSNSAAVYKNPVYNSNTPCRLRMVTLYSIAALLGDARVVCTSNKSEDYIGWATKWGDMVGDFAPLADLTVKEVKQLGYELGISENLIEKKPDDGMCGATDEDKFGFTYEELDGYLLDENPVSKEVYNKIKKMHKTSRHKFKPMPKFTKGE